MERVYLEVGKRRVFACSLAWPGWCRSGKDEDGALAALADAAARYALVAKTASVRFPGPAHVDFEVVARVPGSATTDFGAPGAWVPEDEELPDRNEATRLAALVAAPWRVLDDVVAGAPAVLRKGPRGGGRDRDQIVAHVAEAEQAYARQLGIGSKVADRQAAIVEAIRTPAPGTKWPVRYAARRIAWHVLDHAWEIEDKSEPA